MSIYPGITGTYSPDAWQRAQLMTDGQITDRLLMACDGIAPTVSRAEEMKAHRYSVRTCIYHYRQVVGRWDAKTVAFRLDAVRQAVRLYWRAKEAV